jgi:cytosine deaminase
MTNGFLSLPANLAAYRLIDARIPACLFDAGGLAADADGLARCDLVIDGGRIAAITPPQATDDGPPAYDLDGGIVLPRLVDIHTHLDKGHIWARRRNPDGTHQQARRNVAEDREANWSAADVRVRMDFALRCAFAHGTGAIRTHIDSIGKQTAISWPVFADMREAWKGRVALQAVSLYPIETAVDDEPQFRAMVDTVARHGGLLGGITFLGEAPSEKLDRALDRVFAAAAANGLEVDFHVDESDAAEARSLARIAAAARRTRFAGRILAGHCCSLALYEHGDCAKVIEQIGEAGIAVVSLPMCNMYLQDRRNGRTPRWRGIAPLHELSAAGIDVMVASDNTRDPFYAYGDLDLIEVYREATRIAHLDHCARSWIDTVATAPADHMGLADHGRIVPGGSADLILTRARTFNELLVRPQADRVVVVAGRQIDTTLPDYRELDHLTGGERSISRAGRSPDRDPVPA